MTQDTASQAEARANPNSTVFEDQTFFSIELLVGGHVYLWQQDEKGEFTQINMMPDTLERIARHALAFSARSADDGALREAASGAHAAIKATLADHAVELTRVRLEEAEHALDMALYPSKAVGARFTPEQEAYLTERNLAARPDLRSSAARPAVSKEDLARLLYSFTPHIHEARTAALSSGCSFASWEECVEMVREGYGERADAILQLLQEQGER